MLIFDSIIFSLQKHGGISVYFSEIMRRAGNLKIQSTNLMYGENSTSKDSLFHMNNENIHPRRLERYRNIKPQHAELFHSSYYRTATVNNCINVVTVYDFTYEQFVTGPRKWVHSWQKFNAIRRADAVLCISNNTKQDLQNYLPDVPASKLFVTPLAANPLFKTPAISATVGDYVVFVGARGGYKNFTLLVNALRHVPGIRLCAVGGGSWTAEELALLEKQLPKRYEHKPNVSAEGLRDIYSSAIALVYPSAYEGFGIPVLEAMAAKCPVIALNNSSIPEVAGNAAMLLDTSDETALAVAIDKVSFATVRQDLITKGVAQSQLFSWDATFNTTRSVYEALLGRALH